MDEALSLTKNPNIVICAFGDVLRVPGSKVSPLEVKARGGDIRMVYSPLDALKIAQANPDKEIVFFAIGFETTAPSTALTILKAHASGVNNFSVFCNHVTIGPPLRSILENGELSLNGFIGPGHVSTVIGTRPYDFVAEEFNTPLVVSGFEPVDILESILMLVRMTNQGYAAIENQYVRAVARDGNPAAIGAMTEVFEERTSFEWRGLGFIDNSALRIKDKYDKFDAEAKFEMEEIKSPEPKGAICGSVLIGAKRPQECALLGVSCTPEHPIGALMVSSEGACAAYFTYIHRTKVKIGD